MTHAHIHDKLLQSEMRRSLRRERIPSNPADQPMPDKPRQIKSLDSFRFTEDGKWMLFNMEFVDGEVIPIVLKPDDGTQVAVRLIGVAQHAQAQTPEPDKPVPPAGTVFEGPTLEATTFAIGQGRNPQEVAFLLGAGRFQVAYLLPDKALLALREEVERMAPQTPDQPE
jgi:hypothetical protein